MTSIINIYRVKIVKKIILCFYLLKRTITIECKVIEKAKENEKENEEYEFMGVDR